jgi:hypothetical protein
MPLPKAYLVPLLLLALMWLPGRSFADELPASDLTANANLDADFSRFDPNYLKERQTRIGDLRKLNAEIFAREASGRPTQCSHQILFEIESLLISSADFKTIDARFRDLPDSLAHPESEARAGQADPKTGLWGACYNEWYLKLYDSYDHLEKAAPEEPAPHTLPQFLDRVSTPETLATHLRGLAISDVRKTGIDNEREYNDTLATLLQMLVRGRPENYTLDPALKAAMLGLVLGELRNPQTGWWGETYERDGKREFVDDLSITFHVISYLKGRVPDMPRVIDTALAAKSLDYPVGWLWKGAYWNHNNMDVVTLFRLGWASAGPAQRAAMAAEIDKMLHWCLTESLQPDGSFKPALPDGSVEDGEYYGVEFLVRAGYFDKTLRFWTDRDFPDAAGVKARLLGYLHAHEASGGAGGDSYKGALEALNAPAGN